MTCSDKDCEKKSRVCEKERGSSLRLWLGLLVCGHSGVRRSWREDIGQEAGKEALDALVRGCPERLLAAVAGIIAAGGGRKKGPCRIHHKYDVLEGLGDGLVLGYSINGRAIMP